jgi:hypothetical protein
VEIPDTAVWAAALSVAGTVVAGVKITWTWVTKQFDYKDARVKYLEDQLVTTAQKCADDQARLIQDMTQVYVKKVDEGAEFNRSLLQANMATAAEFTSAVQGLTNEVRRAGDMGGPT